MSKEAPMRKAIRFPGGFVLGLLPVVVLFLFFPLPAVASFAPFENDSGPDSILAGPIMGDRKEGAMAPVKVAQNRPPDRYRNRYEQWKKMEPNEKEALRHRMERWNQMAPQDRERYERRFEQWRHLSPEEQRHIDKKLEGWKDLSPAEKDSIRNRFR